MVKHIRKVVDDASKTLNFLSLAPTETTAQAYQAIVRPKHEHAVSVWEPNHAKWTDKN